MCDSTIRDDADHPEVLAVLNSLQHLQEPRAVLHSLLSLGAQVNDLWTASLLHNLAYPPSGSESPPS